jgi:hypothetical protein
MFTTSGQAASTRVGAIVSLQCVQTARAVGSEPRTIMNASEVGRARRRESETKLYRIGCHCQDFVTIFGIFDGLGRSITERSR